MLSATMHGRFLLDSQVHRLWVFGRVQYFAHYHGVRRKGHGSHRPAMQCYYFGAQGQHQQEQQAGKYNFQQGTHDSFNYYSKLNQYL